MLQLTAVEQHINQRLDNDRDQLSDFDIEILEDCKELIKSILKTKDEKLKKIHTLDLILKFNTFFLK